MGWFARSVLVARVRTVRQYRSSLEQPWVGFLQVFTILFGVLVAVGRLPVAGYESFWTPPGAFVFGRQVAAGDPSVLPTIRGFVGVVFVLLVFLTVLKGATDGSMDTNRDTLLLATDARTVAVGELLWSVAFAGWQFGIPLVAAAIAFGVGSGSVLASVGILLAGSLLFATAVAIGYVAALGIRLGFQTVPVLRENKFVVGAPMALVYFGLFVRARRSIAVLSRLPVGWFGDLGLAFAGAPGVVPVRAGVVLVGTPAILVALTALATALGRRFWYGDPPREDSETDGGVPAAVDGVLTRVASRPVAAVARTTWIRLVRQPRALVFSGLPIALTASLGVEIARARPEALPVVVAVYVAAAVGMGVTLNPLGNAGAGLPATMTAPGGGETLLRGYVVSAVLPGLPLVVLVAGLSGTVVAPGIASLAGGVVVAAVLAWTAAVVSLGVGVKLPNYDSLRATSESGVRPPRLWATTVFMLAMVAVGLPAVVGVGWGPPIAAAVGAPVVAVVFAGVALTTLAAAVASLVAYRVAAREIVEYRIE